MAEVTVRAVSEAVGLRRQSSLEPGLLPLWLARLHQALPIHDTVKFSIEGDLPLRLEDILEGAGFALDNNDLVRLQGLPDVVAPGMRVLVSGLNPSPHAAESGIGFSRPGNRFWPAALDADLVPADRDPHRALIERGIGFTDMVKRTTRRADELTKEEFQAGLARLERLSRWLKPDVLLIVGLTGWRQTTVPGAEPGWQAETVGSAPVYLMPSTSGLNAHETRQSLADHFSAAQADPSITD